MNHEKISVQIYFILILLGFWLLASSLSFGHTAGMLLSDAVCAAVLIFLGAKCRRRISSFEIWTLAAIGIWLQLAPLLFWAPTSGGYLNDTFVGCWVIALATTLHPMPGHTFSEEAKIPPGWSYNPSAWPQRVVIGSIAFCCWMISRYLSAYQLGYIETVWDPFFTPGTKGVLESDIARLFPVSDAGLGAFAYTLEFFAAVHGGTNRWRTAPWLVLVFGILVVPVSLVSAILIILQPLAVGTWCTLCLLTAFLMLSSIPFAIGEVTATLQFLRRSKGKSLAQGAPDTSPAMDQPLATIFKAAFSGITLPWNLCVSALLGMFLLASGDPILGAMTTIIAIISFSEILRKVRFLQLLVSCALIFLSMDSGLHLAIGAATALLVLRKGPIRQQSNLQVS